MRTIDASKGKWPLIFEALGLPPLTRKSHFKGSCPLCGKKNHFRFDDRSGDGDWICTCDNGKGVKLVQLVKGVNFDDACKIVDKIIDNKQKPSSSPSYKTKDQLAEEAFDKLLPINNTDVTQYLKSRGINLTPSHDAIRYDPSCLYDRLTRMQFPAMVGKVLSPIGTYSYRHTTFLSQGRKIEIDPSRKMHSVGSGSTSASIRLFNYENTLGIAEGIESALSAAQIYDVPVWSVLNTTLMKKFVSPDEIKTLIIFADNDSTLSGMAAAYECARRNMLAKNDLKNIMIMTPKILGNDFNDSLMNRTFNTLTYKYQKL